MTTSLRQAKRQQVGDDIIRAALTLFERDGYEHTTIAQIAAAANQSPSTVFRYFGSKEDLLFSDARDHLELLKQDIVRRLEGGASAWAAVTESSLELLRTSYIGTALTWRRVQLWQREPALLARWAEHSSEWEAALAQLLIEHRPGGADSVLSSRVIAASSVAGFRIAMSYAGTEEDADDYLIRVFELFGQGADH